MSGISAAIKRVIVNANRAHYQSASSAIPVASLGMSPTPAHCTHSEGAPGRCLIAGEVAGWFRLAAMQGHSDAQFDLGRMFENGRGVAHDRAEAARWYGMAAAQGHAVATEALARFRA